MPQDHSFDIVSKPNLQEVDNAISMAMKEIANRFDFKGSISNIAKEGDDKIKVVSEDEFKLKNVTTVLFDKLAKRQIPLKFFEFGKVEEALGGTVKQEVKILQGIPQEKAKEITKLIKASGLKVQAQIQSDEIRVSSKKLDDLQAVIAQIKAANFPIALSFINYR
ncbi:YajQ family cyclic di-GMP-binding protein [candidate division WOR-1 bacterium RIFCSPHIGHO2_01_FULL_53_15]|uniref:Nucleotide-binding protein A2625_01690 n=1 Tax=candidate division WOR-1 bacterium RIFCSPHIGHO2_01_FULL_53_15 TaxID=1802564 RepID=A0A1F4Q276_UNCSA|nr:MAG: YajQ family cyclic di-GMP-binding protein [candidate division WOR-1 bacterium RIFCSPHIGHO2_01_FULL_53_15]OGC13637.1 MAG: YajQ family cyclic di-GMP-binding protein [candidate division WOR-1 bacterium RIFCSPHIGHO2_02_FULL_53_26]